MRALATLCGIAVLFTTLAYGHIIHHHLTHAAHADLAFWALMIPAIAAGILSLVGAFLLLKRAR